MVNILRNLQIGISIISFCFALMTLFLILNQKNPIYAVFSFILTVFSVFIIFFIFGAEFLALLVLIIYIGVITVLFLFTVIIYNLRVINIKRSPYFQGWFYLICFKICWFFWNMAHIFNVCAVSTDKNIYVIDVVAYSSLFNEHAILFLFIGLLLFIAILGSVIITAPFHSKHIS